MLPEDFRTARHALGLSQHQLAQTLRMGKWGFQTVGKWERGEAPIPGAVGIALELMVKTSGTGD